MRVEYSTRSVADIREIADHYSTRNDIATAERITARIREVVARVARLPHSGRPVVERPGVRVAPLLRYRYNVFYSYAPDADRVRILHIRHTSRQAWTGPSDPASPA